MGYYLGKDTGTAAHAGTTPQNMTTTAAGADKEQECLQNCQLAYAECIAKAGRGGGGDPATCQSILNNCKAKCDEDEGGDDGGCQEGKVCKGHSDCGKGRCVGVVVDVVNKRITHGKCNCSNPPGDKCKASCLAKGLVEGTREYSECYRKCVDGSRECDEAHPCTAPKVCSPEGKCVDVDTTCPEGKGGTALDGCACGTLYNTKTGKCAAGYKFVKRNNNGVRDDWAKEIDPIPGAVGTCECEKWITPGDGGGGQLGEYQYPAGMQEIMTLLMNRGKGMYGYDPRAIEAMFGKGFGNLRTAQAGSQEDLNKRLASQGMLGTGAAIDQGNNLSWMTEKGISDVARDIMIKNEEQKRSDTELLRSILGSGMGYEQLLEGINSGRRGEGQNALMMWLQLLGLLKG